jgi:glycosyltransferase involved in cell wall biosynthesis
MTYREILKEIVDEVILVDDASRDDTALQAAELGIHTIIHPKNLFAGATRRPVMPKRWQEVQMPS